MKSLWQKCGTSEGEVIIGNTPGPDSLPPLLPPPLCVWMLALGMPPIKPPATWKAVCRCSDQGLQLRAQMTASVNHLTGEASEPLGHYGSQS